MNYTLKFKILILVLGPTLCWTQNLIQNGSFEITTGCPDDFDQFEKAAYWKTVGGSIDLFKECSVSLVDVLPNVPFDYASFVFGDTYTYSLISFPFRLKSDTIFREYMQGELESELNTGSFYFSINAYTNKLNRTNHLGVYFSDIDVDSIGTYPKNIAPQIEFDEWIGDYKSWKVHDGCVDAVEGANYVVVGNFHEPGNDEVEFPTVDFSNGVFLDNLFLSEIKEENDQNLNLILGECLKLDSTVNGIPVEYFVDNIKINDFQICPNGDVTLEQRVRTCGNRIKFIVITTFDCNCKLYVPNVVNLNSSVEINRKVEIGADFECVNSISSIVIYDRWGNQLFDDEVEKLSFNHFEIGVYTYSLSYKCISEEFNKFGSITVVK